MSKRPILLINGRWVRLDELISLKTWLAADPTTPVTGDLVYARRGKPSMVFRTAGEIDLRARRSGRQLIAIHNPDIT